MWWACLLMAASKSVAGVGAGRRLLHGAHRRNLLDSVVGGGRWMLFHRRLPGAGSWLGRDTIITSIT
jgi:hypothetical protein